MKSITDFTDIHTHNLKAGENAVINLPMGMSLPTKGYYSVGIHPWDTAAATDAHFSSIAAMATDERVIAIGETGMDARQGAPLDEQERWLVKHVQLSEQVGKPLIIHAVGTWPQLIALRRRMQPTQRWIVHGFRGKPQLAQELLSHGFDISLGNKFNPATAAMIPPDRLFRETDNDTSIE